MSISSSIERYSVVNQNFKRSRISQCDRKSLISYTNPSDCITPEKRVESNYAIWIVVATILTIDVIAIWAFILLLYFNTPSDAFGLFLKIVGVFSIALGINYLNYVIFHVLKEIKKLIVGCSLMDVRHYILSGNYKTYSGYAVDLKLRKYPYVTIQIPVYQENLVSTISPTIREAMKLATEYNVEAGSNRCNVLICDDGYNSGGLTKSPDDSREIRSRYYQELQKTGIFGVCCRPHNAAFTRNGRFKKAGNLNYYLNFVVPVKDITSDVDTGPLIIENGHGLLSYITKLLDEDSGVSTVSEERYDLLNEFHQHLNRSLDERIPEKFHQKPNIEEEIKPWIQGNVNFGEYTLLLDKDTRLPQNQNTLVKLVSEFLTDQKFSQQILFLQCNTGGFMSEANCIEKTTFTNVNGMYTGIGLYCHMGLFAPLVGHNAIINNALLRQIKLHEMNYQTTYTEYWSEDKISEDYDLMLRGMMHEGTNYYGRYVTYTGYFLEGVTTSYEDEYLKVGKFAFGAFEMLFDSMIKWNGNTPVFNWKIWEKCPSLLLRFLLYSNTSFYNKLFLTAYLVNFVAISIYHILLLINLFAVELYPPAQRPFYLFLWIFVTIVWQILPLFVNLLIALVHRENFFLVLRSGVREAIFSLCLYGSFSVKFSICCLCHWFGLNTTFSATNAASNRGVRNMYVCVYCLACTANISFLNPVFFFLIKIY